MNLLAASLLLATLALGAAEPLAIIVRPDCPVQTMTRQEVADLSLGRRRRLSSGEPALPIERLFPEQARGRFYLALTGLPLSAVRAQWARVLFSGQGQPPRQVPDTRAMLDLVATHRGAVGFLEQGEVTPRVKAVLVLDPDPATRHGGYPTLQVTSPVAHAWQPRRWPG